MTVTAYIALGSNLGQPEQTVRVAAELVGAIPGIVSARLSSLYRTEPVDCPDGMQWFVNAAMELATSLAPDALLAELQSVERRLGRNENHSADHLGHKPRPIDIDLIFHGNTVINTDTLVIPHPRAMQRKFVLEPLAELNPAVIDPLSGKPVRELLESAIRAAGPVVVKLDAA